MRNTQTCHTALSACLHTYIVRPTYGAATDRRPGLDSSMVSCRKSGPPALVAAHWVAPASPSPWSRDGHRCRTKLCACTQVSVGRRAGQRVVVHAPGHQGRCPVASCLRALESPACPPRGDQPRRRWPGAGGPRLVAGPRALSVVDWDGTTCRPWANGSGNLHSPVRGYRGCAHVEEGREGSTLCRPTMAIGRRRGPPWAAGGLGGGGGGGLRCARRTTTDPSLPRLRYTVPHGWRFIVWRHGNAIGKPQGT